MALDDKTLFRVLRNGGLTRQVAQSLIDRFGSAAYLQADSSGVTDGQLFAWSAALGHAVPVNPTGSSELAYASNVTGTGLALTFGGTASGDIAGLTFSIGPTSRPVYLDAGLTYQQTVAGDGNVTISIVSVTDGNAALSPQSVTRVPNSTATGIKTSQVHTQPVRVGALAVAKTYKVTALISNAGAGAAINILNTAAFPSWLRAVVL